MSKFPRQFSVNTAPRPTHYALTDDYYAVTGEVERLRSTDIQFDSDEDRLTVRRKQPDESISASSNSRISPVYRLGDRGPLAVPTGKVFVRFKDRDSLEKHRKEIERAGFKVVQSLPYAPQAGWVEPSSGKIEDAITRFDTLNQIRGVEAVEPQMLLERQRR
jgi:hypothetical protein